MGAGVVGDCVPNHNGLRRTLLAARLWRESKAPLILFTGGRSEGSCPIAMAMAQFAREIGIPASAILTEEASRTTRENGTLGAGSLRERSLRRILVVTDQLHMRRAAGTFVKLGLDVRVASVPIYEGHVDNVSMLIAGVREMAALGYYRMRGWVSAVQAPDTPGANARARAETSRRPETVADGRRIMSVSVGERPVVILGASYAGGWSIENIGNVPVINRGVSGQQSFEFLERFEKDVVSAKPRSVMFWGFINDIFRSAPQDEERTLARIRDSYTQLIALAKRHNIEPILATEVTVRPDDSWSETLASWVGGILGKEGFQDRINRHVMATNAWLIQQARAERILLLDFEKRLADDDGRRRREFTQDDGSHITPAGYDSLTRYAMPILEDHFGTRSDSFVGR